MHILFNNDYENDSGFLAHQMDTIILDIEIPAGFFWEKNIYLTQEMTTPADIKDCLNYCVNIDTENCDFFVFENGFCYMGNSNFTKGTLAAKLTNITVYANTGQRQLPNI